jgi:hypothetical protein
MELCFKSILISLKITIAVHCKNKQNFEYVSDKENCYKSILISLPGERYPLRNLPCRASPYLPWGSSSCMEQPIRETRTCLANRRQLV